MPEPARVQGDAVDCDWALAMRRGAFESAWEIADRDLLAFRKSPTPKHTGPRHLQRIWRGESLRGKRVLVRCYHGLGDTIQFIRFIAPLREIALRVVVWCQPELISIIADVAGVDHVMPLHNGTLEVEHDVDIEIMELPHALRATPAMIAMRGPYLRAGAAPATPAARGRGELSIGLVWQAGDWDQRRSVPARDLARLAGFPGIKLYSLQRGPSSADRHMIPAKDMSTPDLRALADLIAGLDLVICVDTMIAHLCGALGCEAWILLHADCDWRWSPELPHSIWYPSLRLFHQRKAGKWSEVIDEVAKALRTRTKLIESDQFNLDEGFSSTPSWDRWR